MGSKAQEVKTGEKEKPCSTREFQTQGRERSYTNTHKYTLVEKLNTPSDSLQQSC